MPSGKSTVKYDFYAAEQLDTALGQLIAKLDGYLGQREADRRAQLGPAPCDKWSGKKRTTFDGEYKKQQAELHALRDLAARQRGAVQDATTQAQAVANLQRHGNP